MERYQVVARAVWRYEENLLMEFGLSPDTAFALLCYISEHPSDANAAILGLLPDKFARLKKTDEQS